MIKFKKAFFVYFLFLIIANSFGQQFKDSVYKKEFLRLVDSANKYQKNTRKSLQYIKGLVNLSEKQKDTLRLIQMLHTYGRQSQFINENYTSIEAFQKEIELLKNNNLSDDEKSFLERLKIAPIEVYAQLGNNYSTIGETKIGLDYFYKSEAIAKEENLSFYKAVIPVLIGGMQFKAGDYRAALTSYKKGYSLLQTTNEIDELNRKFNSSLTIISMSNAYFKLKEIDSARYILEKGFQQKLDTISGLTRINFQTQKAKLLVEENRFDEAKTQFDFVKKISKEYDANSGVSYYYNDLATYYDKIGNYKEAISVMESGIAIGLTKTKEFNFVDDYKKLAKIYKKAGEIEKSNKYFEKYVFNQSSLEKNKKHIVDSFHNKEVLDLESKRKSEKKVTFYLFLIGGLLIAILAFYAFSISVKRKKETLKFKALLEKIASTKAEVVDTKDIVLEEKTTSDINKETFDEILYGLQKMEEQHYYLKQECSSYNVAKKIKTNTSYLSKVINAHYQKNFNTYINDLRINYAILKLKEDTRFRSYAIQSISEDIGYKSPDSFTKYFKRRTGLLPSVYIKKLNSIT